MSENGTTGTSSVSTASSPSHIVFSLHALSNDSGMNTTLWFGCPGFEFDNEVAHAFNSFEPLKSDAGLRPRYSTSASNVVLLAPLIVAGSNPLTHFWPLS